jgi:YidC/Oxa1 family membrane protein insertase
MFEWFHTIFFEPIFNLLILLVSFMPRHDFGLAIIALTVLVKLLLWPLAQKALKSQKALAAIQPELKHIKEKFKGDKEAQGKAMLELYKREKVSPASSCIMVIVQLPFFIALYRSMLAVINSTDGLTGLYGWVPDIGSVDPMLLGLLDLSKPSYMLAILAGAAQFWQSHMTVRQQQPHVGKESKDEETMAVVNRQMMYMMPVVTIVLGFTLPGALGLYWLVMTLMTIGQQWLMMRDLKLKPVTEAGVMEAQVVGPPPAAKPTLTERVMAWLQQYGEKTRKEMAERKAGKNREK